MMVAGLLSRYHWLELMITSCDFFAPARSLRKSCNHADVTICNYTTRYKISSKYFRRSCDGPVEINLL